MQTNLTSKPELRAFFQRQTREQLASQNKNALDIIIQENLWLVLSRVQGPCGVYRSLDSEPDLAQLTDDAATGVWAFPKVNQNNLEYYKVNSPADFSRGTFGVSEPIANENMHVPLNNLAAMVIPAVAYDRKGNRLGRGKGYYDRTLQGFDGPKIGVCYSFQIAREQLPCESHDAPVDVIVTEKFILSPTAVGEVKG